jgi:hypothetical protein
VTGWKGIRSPLRHPIPPLVYREIRVSPISSWSGRWFGLQNFDCGLFRLPDLETPVFTDFCVWNGAHCGCAGRQGMLTSPRRMISHLVYCKQTSIPERENFVRFLHRCDHFCRESYLLCSSVWMKKVRSRQLIAINSLLLKSRKIKYSADWTQPNTRANPGLVPWVRSAFAFKNFAFALGSLWVRYGSALRPLCVRSGSALRSLWVRYGFALGSLSGCALRTHAWSGPCFYLAARKPRPLYIPNIYSVAISVIVDFVVR